MSLVSRINFFHFSLSLSTRSLKYFLSGEAKVFEGCSVFGVQNPFFSIFTFTFYQIFKIFLVRRAKVLEECSVFGVQNPLSPGLMAAKGGKCLHPSFALPPLFYFFIFHFLFQLFFIEIQISNTF